MHWNFGGKSFGGLLRHHKKIVHPKPSALLPSPVHQTNQSLGTRRIMSGLENSSWNSSLQAQYDQAVSDLLVLLDAQDSLQDQIEAQEALIALLAALLAPPE